MEKFKTEKNVFADYGSKLALRQNGMREQLDWIRRQLEYFSFAEKYSLRYDLKQGEIYEFDWGLNVNAEFSNRHYGVVMVDSDVFNPLVTICPLKTNHGSMCPRSDVDLGIIECLNTSKSTFAVVNQVRTIDKLRLYTKRIIGVKTDMLSDSNVEEEYTIMRLENSKFQMIQKAYFEYLNGKLGDIRER